MSNYSLRIDIDLDFKLAGIISPLKDYQICWQLNQALNIDMIRQEDLFSYEGDRQPTMPFSKYYYLDALNKTNYHLIANKTKGSVYLSELKQVDYLLLIKESQGLLNVTEFIQKISQINKVQMAFNIDVESLRTPQKLIFDDYS